MESVIEVWVRGRLVLQVELEYTCQKFALFFDGRYDPETRNVHNKWDKEVKCYFCRPNGRTDIRVWCIATADDNTICGLCFFSTGNQHPDLSRVYWLDDTAFMDGEEDALSVAFADWFDCLSKLKKHMVEEGMCCVAQWNDKTLHFKKGLPRDARQAKIVKRQGCTGFFLGGGLLDLVESAKQKHMDTIEVRDAS